ncbi:MAG: hypothetical protein KGR48_03515 [Alphaproteobacteria bacterium]|nr:hypothetical protein [Alphaproteobacteria bacterium]MBU6473976.1 hypothetical protein [Alphaproteobacteria bacterium]MDE2012019.1 hypothetical protein [Alphaproteobacteria bacterium]MDE2073529.1 hypothetical protein [Alphaproteobacteria bacterium]MDE2352035.1 hypothetical protein [Alphaproteobacteria bacterium]
MTRLFTDEQLSAYLDGAGDPEVCAAIDQALATDITLQRRLERFRRADQLLREAVDNRLGHMPARLEQMATGQIAVAGFGARKRLPVRRLAQFAAMAAALLIAFGVGMKLGTGPAPSAPVLSLGPDGLVAGPVLAHAISTAYSGEPVKTEAGAVSVALSFRSSAGNLCRRFRLDQGAQSQTVVACRQDGSWRIEGWTSSPPEPSDNGFTTASGPSNAAIDAVIRKLGLAQALNRGEEASAIKSGWQSKAH